MRNRWEDKGGGDDLDTPVTLTEGKLRSLERGAKLGMFGLILGLVALGAAGWSIFRAPKAAAPATETEATSAPAPAATDTAAAQPAAATAPTPAPTASTAPVAPPTQVAGGPAPATAAVNASTEKHTVKAVTASAHPKRVGRQAHGTARYTGARAKPGGPAPKMESFDPGPAKPAAATTMPTPTPVPVPVSPAPGKAAADSTKKH